MDFLVGGPVVRATRSPVDPVWINAVHMRPIDIYSPVVRDAYVKPAGYSSMYFDSRILASANGNVEPAASRLPQSAALQAL